MIHVNNASPRGFFSGPRLCATKPLGDSHFRGRARRRSEQPLSSDALAVSLHPAEHRQRRIAGALQVQSCSREKYLAALRGMRDSSCS
jgi:hypothetical protein